MLEFLLLAFVWLLWSGHYTLEKSLIAGFGLLSCLAVVALSRRMASSSRYRPRRTLGPRTLLYLPWLLWQIVKANIQVARIILDPRLPISPRVIRVKTSQRGERAQVLYANSITLTPGTISLDVSLDTITVHALTEGIARDLESGEMDRKVTWAERTP
jgi:multicomponent Na+:H+ antiporter subunit E